MFLSAKVIRRLLWIVVVTDLLLPTNVVVVEQRRNVNVLSNKVEHRLRRVCQRHAW